LNRILSTRYNNHCLVTTFSTTSISCGNINSELILNRILSIRYNNHCLVATFSTTSISCGNTNSELILNRILSTRYNNHCLVTTFSTTSISYGNINSELILNRILSTRYNNHCLVTKEWKWEWRMPISSYPQFRLQSQTLQPWQRRVCRRKWDTRPEISSVLASDTVVNMAKEHSGVLSQSTVITGATNRKLSRATKTLYWGKLVNTIDDMMLKLKTINNMQSLALNM
jgi:hypothetical protein